MKFSSIKYLTKEGFRNVMSNWLMSLSSVMVLMCCLFLTGTVVLFSGGINKMMRTVNEKNSVTVYLKSEVSSEDAAKIGEQIKKNSNISECEFISKDEVLQKYNKALKGLKDRLEGQLLDTFNVKMKDLSKYEETEKAIGDITGVESITDRREVAQKLTDINRIVIAIEIVVMLVFGMVSLFIVSNTIRVTMYSRRQEIRIMKSVGATNLFIRIPFIVEGVTIGLIASIVSVILLRFVSGLLIVAMGRLLPFTGSTFEGVNSTMVLTFLLTGIIFGLMGGFVSISKYLKREGGEILGL